MILTPEEAGRIRAHAEQTYPEECCGVGLERSGGGRLLIPCRNVQAELHQRDPAHFRPARLAYTIHPEDLLAVSKRLARGWRLSLIYHSHVEGPAGFSREDQRLALLDGSPVVPGSHYAVVAVSEGRAGDLEVWGWDAAGWRFVFLEAA